ncbi:MAG: heparan-alpha-glucosaminide N-acetyltransferase domain-containing protein [Flavobacteriaceae bacterium]|nr:heparan-alpha-glucosaminide N-acetyltransferase domain-containing protein [Flavobacteriaceae bacterium]
MEQTPIENLSGNSHFKRVESIDILRGLVMVIMALDHTRDYFHYGAFLGDPTNLQTTTPILFFTRFVTHFCAPVFVFLAGTSAFMVAGKKTKSVVFTFLFTRGNRWLIFLQVILNNLTWNF